MTYININNDEMTKIQVTLDEARNEDDDILESDGFKEEWQSAVERAIERLDNTQAKIHYVLIQINKD